MSLRAQIELITVPQEFTRLCNAILIAEHGDDFLPIDDDRADRGNDGYLKSERRMFAVHCFKRAQNQGVDSLVRAKMIGDLGKAIALKQADAWPVDAWTFLSNYPVPERLAAEVATMGRKADVDVAWRGPEYLADALTRHKHLVEAFPGLQIADVAERLAGLEGHLLAESAGVDSGETHDGPPRTPQEQERLLATRPPAWEYLLFAGVLRQRRDALAAKWRDHELRLPRRERMFVDGDDMTDRLARAFGRLASIVDPMARVFEHQEAAFGAPGEPGDPVRIEHFGDWIMNAYEDLLDWAAELRALDAPEVFGKAIESVARCAEQPASDIRRFVDQLVDECERIPTFFAIPEHARGDARLVIEADLVLSSNAELMERAVREIKKAVKRYRRGW